MKLRKLEMKDAPMMLEWMHDKDVVRDLSANFAAKTIDDCQIFIRKSDDNKQEIHMAIVDDADEYMGTVSLKHIQSKFGTAEFAIAVRTRAMGKGFSKFGMAQIIQYGLEILKLDAIYWCVHKENQRAIRFYDKNGYSRIEEVPGHIRNEYTKEQCGKFLWYMKKNEK